MFLGVHWYLCIQLCSDGWKNEHNNKNKKTFSSAQIIHGRRLKTTLSEERRGEGGIWKITLSFLLSNPVFSGKVPFLPVRLHFWALSHVVFIPQNSQTNLQKGLSKCFFGLKSTKIAHFRPKIPEKVPKTAIFRRPKGGGVQIFS